MEILSDITGRRSPDGPERIDYKGEGDTVSRPIGPLRAASGRPVGLTIFSNKIRL
jgi:hypothetical protein